MKKFSILLINILFLSIFLKINAQYLPANISNNTPLNSIVELTPKKPIKEEVNVKNLNLTVEEIDRKIQYIDGIGRPIQTIQWQGSPLKKDIVNSNIYDAFGRESFQYLPYSVDFALGQEGVFRYKAFEEQKQFFTSTFFVDNEQFYYSQQIFENNPMSRSNKVMPVGNSWVGSGKGISKEFSLSTIANDIKKWTISIGINNIIPTNLGVFNNGDLFNTIITDEHGKKVIEFKNDKDQVILKKVQIDNTITEGYYGWLCTYYVYDDFGNLRFVIPPKAVTFLKTNGWNFNAPNGTTIVNELCFYYLYDAQNRMVIKKVPGAGEVHMVYDERDRLCMTQDANMRINNKWMVVLYDQLNRPIKTGLWNNGNTRQTHATAAEAQSTTVAYPWATEPTTGWELLSETGFDDYSALNTTSGLATSLDNTHINGSNFITNYLVAPHYAEPITSSTANKGMPTWTKVKVLNNATTPTYLYTVTIYDEKGRPIQTKSKNITGGIDIATMQYDFSGKIIRNHMSHQKLGTNSQTYLTTTKPSYDHMGRLLNVVKNIGTISNAGTEKTILQNTYNELGQLKTKKLAPEYNSNQGIETLKYDYNIRGWLLGVNRDYISNTANSSDYFGFELGYDKPTNFTNAASQGPPCSGCVSTANLNGNISEMAWKTKGDKVSRKFDFGYDNANRLLKADFTQFTAYQATGAPWQGQIFDQNTDLNFNVKMGDGVNHNTAYDENGNIKQMQQWGFKMGGNLQIDNLQYSYENNSNKLKQVTDLNNDNNSKLGDFKYNPATKTITDYIYDINGNLISDKNKDLSAITYNYLNLPNTITKTGTGSTGNIKYIYDATGNKLQKITTETGGAITTTTYIGGFIYESKSTVNAGADELQFAAHEEGRFRLVNNNWVTDYMLKDHLGNVRMVLTDEVKQDVYVAATLEGSTAVGANSMVNDEKKYYDINTAYIANTTSLPNWNNANDYENNNGNPPYNNNYATTTASNPSAISDKVYQLNATQNKTGLGIILKVMAGDRLDIFAKSYHNQVGNFNNSNSTPLSFLNIFTGMLNAPDNVGLSTKGATAANVAATNNGVDALQQFTTGTNGETSNTPKAYINYIFFDEQLKYAGGGVERVGTNGLVTSHTMLNKQAPKNGYVYVYVSNESNVNVYFDNLQVAHTRSAILEETHYYPFGLAMAGISSKAAGGLENKRKWNAGSELQSNEFSDGSGLELYSTFYRSLDPQLGRFWQIDPKPDYSQSLYSSMNNNPIKFNDPLGDTIGVNLQPFNNDEILKSEANQISKMNVNDGIFVVLAHANPDGIQYLSKNGEKLNLATTPAEFHKVMSRMSPEYAKAFEKGEIKQLIILGCRTAAEKSPEHDGSITLQPNPIAKKISTSLPKSLVVAANGYVVHTIQGGVGKVVGVSNSATNNGGFVYYINGIKVAFKKQNYVDSTGAVEQKKKVKLIN